MEEGIVKVAQSFPRLTLCIACLVGALTAGICASAPAETLTLDESIRIALENNPSVRMARESLRKADAMVDEALSAGLPKLDVEFTYQRLDEVPVAEFGDAKVELGTLDNRTADLNLAQPVDVFGMVRTARGAAKSGKSAYRHGLDRQVNDTTLEVKQAFFNVLRAQGYLKVQQDTIALLEGHLRDAEASFAAGAVAKFEVLRAETQLANARQGLIGAENGVRLAKAAFNNVLGRPIETPVELAEPPAPDFVEVDLSKCVETALESRPEILQSEMLLDMNDKLVDVAKLSGKPKVNFLWNYNRNFDVTMFNPRESSWRAFLIASMPIYDGGATRAAVGKASSDAETAKLTLEQVTNGVSLDAKQSHLNLSESQERIRAAEKALEQARESMRLAEVRYKSGVSVQLELLDAQAALTLAETNYVNALHDYQVALAKLERAVGGQQQMAKLLTAGK